MNTEIKKTKGRRIFWIVVLFLFGIVAIEIGLRFYDKWESQRLIDDMAVELERMETDRQSAMEADKIGGNTPQETLEMFIKAVEEGDYELASKYFVIEEQEKWRGDLEDISVAGKMDIFLSPLKKTELDNCEKESCLAHDPVLVSFILYPSGNWKIEKI